MPNNEWIKSDLQSSYEEFCDAFKAGDDEKLGSLYVESAVMVLPRGRILSGRSEIQAFWTRAQKILGLHFETIGARQLGDDFYREVGDFQVTVRGTGRQTQTVNAKFMCLWQKLEGVWKLDTFVWSKAAGLTGPNSRSDLDANYPGRGGGRIAAGQGGRFSRKPRADEPPMVRRSGD